MGEKGREGGKEEEGSGGGTIARGNVNDSFVSKCG